LFLSPNYHNFKIFTKISFIKNNIPVLPVNLRRGAFSFENIRNEIKRAFKNYDMKEGEDIVALYFKEYIDHTDSLLSTLAKAIESSLPHSVAQNKPIILIFSMDIAFFIRKIFIK